ncbi:zinc/manganese transport system permease protein [Actinacidiphila alni]|uniref:Zinc/manganese transport system permease protein n=1 Tax=Actinacidiphila alni TaxID=380248 RepID=A0A1I2CGZ7_9ACTN|nr:metal ABC transporter permease [Actinacidiphila alni]SFE67627.1 zinc/manganese transport system permease protein [Actinacidiphila alni]
MTGVGLALPGALGHPFFLHAVLAGAAIAAASGMIGYFLVLRAQVFTGDALGHAAFTGALAALADGVDLRLGLFAATVVIALLLGALGRSGRADDIAIGSVFAWITGLGAFFLTMYATSGGADNAGAGVRVLFGSIFGLSAKQAVTAAVVAAAVCGAVLAVFRPLLFASVDPAVAAARGVPVRVLGFVFLALVGVTAGEATQAVGSLLLLGLLAAPAGTAQRLTDNPARAFVLSAVLAVADMWGGLAASYALPSMPPSFAVVALATALYAAAFAVGPYRRRTAASRAG